MSFTIAIVGRPNVGKSTLFNRLIGQQKAIVDNVSGVTRDRQYGNGEWTGKSFYVVDTGGFVDGSDDVFEKEIHKQVKMAIEEASVIIFVTDCTTGITDYDDSVAKLLRKCPKPVFLAVNKVDNNTRMLAATEFYSMGFEEIHFISSMDGAGIGDLLDQVCSHIKEDDDVEEVDHLPRIAIVGQPNVGKSSMLNALVGEERSIVSDISGTTRDSIHTRYNLFGKDFIIVDTAGLRKKGKVHEDLEFYSVIRAIKALDEADIVVLMVDVTDGFTAQDVNIFSLATRKGKGVVIVVNKWDLVEDKQTMTSVEMERQIKARIAPFTDVPILFTSVKEKQRIFRAVETALEVAENRQRKIPTSQLNDIMLKEIEKFPPPYHRGNQIKIKFVNQLPVAVPSFTFFTNYPEDVPAHYQHYLENRIRDRFKFSGVPVRVFFRKK